MRILIFSTAYFPHVGGAEVAVKEITGRIPDGGFDMLTVRLDASEAAKEKIGNVMVYRLGRGAGRVDKFLFPFRAVRLATRLHRQHPYDATWSIMASFSGFAAVLFKRRHPEVPYILTLQEGDDLAVVEHKARFVWPWFKRIFVIADYITCISGYLAEWARKMGAKGLVTVVPNGVNLNTEGKMKNVEFKQELGVDESEKIILTTSRLVHKNGIDILLRAVAGLKNHTLIICGSGPDEAKLKNLADELSIADRVVWAGFIKPEELPAYYALADVFCRPSRSEGLGNSFLEAMAAGVPVVATPVGGIVDFLREGRTGWLAQPEDPQSVAKKLAYVLDEKNATEVEVVVQRAKQLVEREYDWERIAEKMRNIFENVRRV